MLEQIGYNIGMVVLVKMRLVVPARPAIEVDGVVDGGAKAGRSMSRKGYEDAEPFCGDDDFWHGGDRYAEWKGDGTDCGDPIYPMIGAFFMHPVRSGHNNDNLAAVRVCDVNVETRKLYFDQYMTPEDLSTLQTSEPFLVAAGESIEMPSAGGQLYANNQVLATSCWF